MVSIIFPSSKITMMPPAKPTTKAADKISFAPKINSFTISLADFPMEIPAANPIMKNRDAISSKPHSNPITPATNIKMVKNKMFNTKY